MLGSASIGAFSLFKSFFSLSVFPLLVLAFSFIGGAQAYTAASDAVRLLPKIDFAGKSATADARIAAHWVAANADNQRLPFVIVDKKNAQIFVFDANRQLFQKIPRNGLLIFTKMATPNGISTKDWDPDGRSMRSGDALGHFH